MILYSIQFSGFLPSLLLYFGCSSYDINSEVCIERLFGFVSKACRFTLKDAKDWLESADCPKECHVIISNLSGTKWFSYGTFYTAVYELRSIDLCFNGLSESLKTINISCERSFADSRSMTVICKSGFENAKDLCTSTKKCEDETKTCLLKGQIGVCVCNPGYIGFKNECLEGNLTLNGTCKRNEQCSMVFGSVCQNNTCVCGLGYKSLNDSKYL
ncbi:uncharacterized protein LOC134230863, partial [Saccostrea cucullata]|uniref:uncharacterized protein LOC134230863 n=1 Tax=Saccostrea cuccullata TaxID=36930 RepID=UPI002ED39CC4